MFSLQEKISLRLAAFVDIFNNPDKYYGCNSKEVKNIVEFDNRVMYGLKGYKNLDTDFKELILKVNSILCKINEL